MTKNWIRFSAFCLLFVFVFTFLNNAFALRWGGWNDFYKLPKNSVDILFLGNSHGYFAFNPKIVDDVTSMNSYVLGIPGESIDLTYYELKTALKYQQPKIIVMETNTASRKMGATGYFFRYIDDVRFDENKLQVFIKYLFPHQLADIFPVLRTRPDWEHPATFFSTISRYVRKFNSQKIDPNKGHEVFWNVISDDLFFDKSQHSKMGSYNPPQDNQEFLEKIVQLCKEKDIKLVFITTPMLENFDDNPNFDDRMNIGNYAKANGITRYTFNLANLSQIYFLDSQHVNELGATVLTSEVSTYIAKELGVSTDEAKIADYLNFAGFAFTKENNDNHYKITIQNKENSANFVYRWVLVADKKKLDEGDWSPANSFSFDLPQARNVNVEVEIQDVDTGYTVKCVFSIVKEK